jgi:hypothetical protein
MYPTKVLESFNASTLLTTFYFFDGKWLPCAARVFFCTKFSKLPSYLLCNIIIKNYYM